MDIIDTLIIPEKRIASAKFLIERIAPTFDQKNVFGVAGFGSFFLPYSKHRPNDIDLAFYIKNDSMFIKEDKLKILPLSNLFNIPIDTHLITPYTPSIKNELEITQTKLKEMILLWGMMPNWVSKIPQNNAT